MVLHWFNTRQASEAGAALADKITPSARGVENADGQRRADSAREIGRLAGGDVRDLSLNFLQRAKLANAFKWRLIENGVEKRVADAVTHSMVIDLGTKRAASAPASPEGSAAKDGESVDELFNRAGDLINRGQREAAVGVFDELLQRDPRNVRAINGLGLLLLDLGRLIQAEQAFRSVISLEPGLVDGHRNLGTVLRLRGFFGESENALRQAARLRPDALDVQCGLGLTLISRGKVHDAKGRFRKVLKTRPRDLAALHGTAQIAFREGQWAEADRLFHQILELDPQNVAALVGKSNLREAGSTDPSWLGTAESVAATITHPGQEAALRYAIGTYLDGISEHERAFQSVKRANELLRNAAEPYNRKDRASTVQDLIRSYPQGFTAQLGQGVSDSSLPVFVVGMPSSGTSVIERIIAAHPDARGAGELDFWTKAAHDLGGQIRQGLLDPQTRRRLAEGYLDELRSSAAMAPKEDLSRVLKIADMAPVNSDYLGIIHSVFPKARFIYARREPLDTCLSCYFQELPLTLNFSLDLGDLAHYYTQHQRLYNHWREVLPEESILEVSYEALVRDQETWSRKILEFIGLDWNTQQARLKTHDSSIERWRKYEKFIGPLMTVRKA